MNQIDRLFLGVGLGLTTMIFVNILVLMVRVKDVKEVCGR